MSQAVYSGTKKKSLSLLNIPDVLELEICGVCAFFHVAFQLSVFPLVVASILVVILFKKKKTTTAAI